MLGKPKILLCLFTLWCLSLTSVVYAAGVEDIVSLVDFPQWLADGLGVGLSVGQIFTVAIFFSIFVVPVAILHKGLLGIFSVGVLVLSFCLVMGWLPTWFLSVLAITIAAFLSGKIRNWISGKSG